jgi:glycosyltransferase involved in cell wall biosynthesis
MRVVIINETFSPKMGYLGTMLPKYLAREGLEVHVLATDLPAYHNMREAGGVPEFISSQTLSGGRTLELDGYTAHIQPHGRALGHVFMKGMSRKLRELKPDIVYSVLTLGWMPLQAAALRPGLGFKLFTGSHTSALMFPLARAKSISIAERLRNFCTRWLPGRLVSLAAQKCYCPTDDCGEVAWRFFGVQRAKVEIIHLGVDPEFFFPLKSPADRQERQALRQQLGFGDNDVVCIYTGKMAELKNPVLLAKAVERLRSEGRPFKALFIGDGAQRAVVETYPNCAVLDFMLFKELGRYYRACDIAVWLTNESTSMLDAAACGIPIIVSDRIYQDHVSGNGVSYKMNDLDSLCEVLRGLENPASRQALGAAGAQKMSERFSWIQAAARRVQDFKLALGK